MTIPVIAIDGAAGSGKGALSKLLADKLKFNYLDSGKIYRLVSWGVLSRNMSIDNENDCIEISKEIAASKNIFSMLANEELSLPEVGRGASKLAVYDALRKELLSFQRNMRKPPGLVADGRDMQTTVFPDAALKVFLQCDLAVRARRRFMQYNQNNINTRLREIFIDLKDRDNRDFNRKSSPLKKSKEAIVINTENTNPVILAEIICNEFKKRNNTIEHSNE